jgi:hypothetical protein
MSAAATTIEAAFDYRGFVTVTRRDGTTVVGYLYNRDARQVDLLDETATRRLQIPVEDVAAIALTGEDAAAKAQAIWQRRRGALEPAATSRFGDWATHPTLIVVALPGELRAVARGLGATLRRGVARTSTAVVVATGVGGGAAAAIERHHPGLAISCGFAGAVTDTLRTGDLVLATAVHDDTGDVVAADPRRVTAARDQLAGVGVVTGELASASAVATTRDAKHALARTGAIAVDLESWAVARAAARAGIPWLALRVVLDPLALDLPAFVAEPRASYVMPALRHALRGPRAALGLVDLARRARIAARALAAAVPRVVGAA